MAGNLETSAPKRKSSFLRTTASMAFFGMFFPLAILLPLFPASWFCAEGYEDLGIREFVASEVSSRVSRHNKLERDVIYRAADESGLTFKIRYPRPTAERLVEAQERIRRHVYLPKEQPPLLYQLFSKFEMRFVSPDIDLQADLDAYRKNYVFSRNLSLCYVSIYIAAVLIRRRKRKKQQILDGTAEEEKAPYNSNSPGT